MDKSKTDKNLRTFKLGIAVTFMTDVTHQSPWHARDSRPKLISELCRIDGVKCVYLDRSSVDITKAESCNWADLLPEIERIIAVHGCSKSAGFDSVVQFENLEPMMAF